MINGVHRKEEKQKLHKYSFCRPIVWKILPLSFYLGGPQTVYVVILGFIKITEKFRPQITLWWH